MFTSFNHPSTTNLHGPHLHNSSPGASWVVVTELGGGFATGAAAGCRPISMFSRTGWCSLRWSCLVHDQVLQPSNQGEGCYYSQKKEKYRKKKYIYVNTYGLILALFSNWQLVVRRIPWFLAVLVRMPLLGS